jgi:hypothetical protein
MTTHRTNILIILTVVISFTAYGQKKTLKFIEPTIGFTPDISVEAQKNLDQFKKMFVSVDSIVNSYPNYETAKKHLTGRQISVYDNVEEYNKRDYLDVAGVGCSWYCGGGPDRIFTSSTLPSKDNLDYKADNIHDFSLRTAWVEAVKGYGIGESVTFRFPKESPPVTTVNIYNGYMKSNKAWHDNSRVKQLKLYVNNKPYAILNLKDIKSNQIFEIDTLQGVDKDLFLKFEIASVYKGDIYDDVAISEIEFTGIGVHCFAKGTLVSTPSGQVEIEKLVIGDKILSLNELTSAVETSTILEVANQKHHNLYELSFSGKILTVTDDHPFYFNGQYYSISENSKYGQQTKLLQRGQQLGFLINGQLQTMELTAIKQLELCETTYTITKLDRNKLFFANGACVGTEEIVMTTAHND